VGAAFNPLSFRLEQVTPLVDSQMPVTQSPQLPRFSQQDDDIDLRALVANLVSYRQLIGVVTALALVIGYIQAWLATPIYQVDVSVQVEDSKGSALGSAMKDLDGLFETKSQATTEIELLRSRMVLGRTVDTLGLDIVVEPQYFPFIGRALARRYQGLQPAEAWFGMTHYAWGGDSLKVTRLLVPDLWEGRALTLIAQANGRYELLDPEGQSLGQGRVGVEFLPEAGQGQVGLFVQTLTARPGVHFSVMKQPRLSSINRVQEQLSVSEKSKQSGIIQLTFRDADAKHAVRVLNTVANEYVRQNVERKSAEAEQTLKYLDQQLPETKKELEAAEVRFNDYRSRNGTVDVSRESDILLQRTVAAETGLVELQQKRKELLGRFTSEHPSVRTLDTQIKTIQAQRNKFAGEIDGLPQTQQEVLRLTRDLQVNQGIYTSLLNSSQQLKVVRGGTVGNVRIVDYAEKPLSPIEPQRAKILASALLSGLLLGIVLAVLMHALRRGIKEARVIESKLGLSVFATIPQSAIQAQLESTRSRSSGKLYLLALKDEQDTAIESLRSLRTTLHFASLDARNNILLIAGPAPGVGKSFVSANLAAVLNQSGERVLLIDADLRRGHLNEYFGRPRGIGLTDYIAGKATIDDVIVSTGCAGFDFMTTGSIPPNPSELLLHPNFEHLLLEVSGRYDRVIIDAPPVMAVTDAAIVGRHAGTVLMTVRYAKTPLAELEGACRRLQQAGVTVHGVLLNGIDELGGYGYGYGYQYTYAYRSNKTR
jgi:tyrosine-protein kinase Etk/Wzc